MQRILVVDDHEIFRSGLVALLSTVYDEVDILEAADAESVETVISAGMPDLIILDHEIPGESGLEIYRKLRARYPTVRVIFLTAMHSGMLVRQLVAEGAVAVLGKSGSGDELLAVIERELSGPTYVSDVFNGDLEKTELLDSLSRREMESLKFLLDGKTTQEIADEMGVSFKTAESHRTRLMAKLDVHSYGELVSRLRTMGIDEL